MPARGLQDLCAFALRDVDVSGCTRTAATAEEAPENDALFGGQTIDPIDARTVTDHVDTQFRA